METTDVIIVGAAKQPCPFALSYYKSVILEKNRDICQDPRGIALAGDSHRIMELLRISPEGDSLPSGFVQQQTLSQRGQLFRLPQSKPTGCHINPTAPPRGRTAEPPPVFGVCPAQNRARRIHYAAKWIAANLHITIPTPKSHPYFPLWKLGYEPEEVWDIFWPEGFQFEYELTSETFWEEAEQDALKQLEARMEPHLTIPAARFRKPVLIDITTSGNKTRRTCSIPWDCVEALERRKGVDDAMTMTMRNGLLLSNKSGYIAAFLSVLGSALGYLPRLRDCIARRALMDNDGYAGLDRGFFLTGQHGAGKTAQIWFKMADGTILLSDHIFRESTSILTVLVLGSVTAQEASELKQVIDSGELPPNILAENVVILRGEKLPCNSVAAPWISELFPCRPDDLEKMGVSLLRGYDPASFRRRFHSSTRYVLVRPDFIVSSQAKSIEELAGQLGQVKKLLAQK
ncbi:hypothetical protein IWW34DRAFT_881313 [Fusarium oxysporum f. sp. albedinis]|nr:hypothetical protein IWW34DRAFT_881313 [Fusarium oxysporum f. sp. albedinis]